MSLCLSTLCQCLCLWLYLCQCLCLCLKLRVIFFGPQHGFGKRHITILRMVFLLVSTNMVEFLVSIHSPTKFIKKPSLMNEMCDNFYFLYISFYLVRVNIQVRPTQKPIMYQVLRSLFIYFKWSCYFSIILLYPAWRTWKAISLAESANYVK